MENENRILQRLTAVEANLAAQKAMLDEQKTLIDGIRALATEVKYMRNELNKMQADLDEIKTKPARRYELLLTAILTAISSGAATFVLSRIFGNIL